ncbi:MULTISPECIES: ROK family protein [Bacillaceae]|uniref:ROK family protein n=1 Tax=Bacillaceae TaxID=186817 RepID=UPI000BFD93DD|nr:MULTISPECIES: ROK family protein [Bacillaceae]PGT89062.1 glucose kinase [Bacillus sp. AFS040349]UGB30718.1 ROK family protein [Metabacillus sp. B2-18]
MHTIGIDLGGTNLRIGVFNEQGEIINEQSQSTEAAKGPEYVINQMAEIINKLKSTYKIKAVGIGSPGPLNPHDGIIIEPPNLPGWVNIPIVQLLEEKTNLPVKLENDANAAALAEATLGAGKGASSVFFITVSTGIGGGYVLNGELVSGAQGSCGEIGNMIVNPSPDAYQGPGLNKGALEGLASGTAIGRIGQERLNITNGAQGVFQLAEQGNKEAQSILDEAINYLAIGLANIVHTVNPEIIVIGGGVMKSKELILEPLINKTKEYVYPSLKETLIIIPALLDQKAGLIGAGLLPK